MNDLNAALAESPPWKTSSPPNCPDKGRARLSDRRGRHPRAGGCDERRAEVDQEAVQKERAVKADFERRLADKRKTVKSLQDRARYDARSVEEAGNSRRRWTTSKNSSI
jgi:hypothetical protein